MVFCTELASHTRSIQRGNYGSPVEDDPPIPSVVPEEKTEPSSGATSRWMGNGTGTSGWFNWTSGTQSTAGKIWGTRGRVESLAGFSTVGVES